MPRKLLLEGEVMIDVTIEGVTPLRMSKMSLESIQSLQGSTSMVVKGQRPKPDEEAFNNGHFNEKTREPFLPSECLFYCLSDAGQFLKAGRSKLSTKTTSRVGALVRMTAEVLPIYMPSENGNKPQPAKWSPMLCIPNTKTGDRIAVWRPLFNDWSIPFQMVVDSQNMPMAQARALVDAAGKWIGLGNMRVGRRGGRFGQFVVTNWKVTTPA